MTVLLEIKEKLKSIYAEYAYMIILVLKFILTLTVLFSINRTMGFWEPLKTIYLILMLSLLGSLLSVKAIAVFAGIFILGHSYALGVEVLCVTAILFLLLFLFFLRFDEKDGLALILTPLALYLEIPVFVPICYALKRKPASSVSVASGAVIHFYIKMLSEKASLIQNTDKSDLFESMVTNLRILVDGFLQNRLMILTVVALILAFCVVYVVRRFSLDYVWHIAIGAGAVVYLITMISGGLFLDIEIATVMVVIGTLISVVIALVMEFFVLSVDYSRTERMEFEDDEYYYYVKAVPKMTISKSQREIKTISGEPEEIQTGNDAEEETVIIVENDNSERADYEPEQGEIEDVADSEEAELLIEEESVEPKESRIKIFVAQKLKPGLSNLIKGKIRPALHRMNVFIREKAKLLWMWLKKTLQKCKDQLQLWWKKISKKK